MRKTFNDPEIGSYTVTKRKSAKRITLSIAKSGLPNVTIPYYRSYKLANSFITKQGDWIKAHKLNPVTFADGNNFNLYDDTEVIIHSAGERNSSKISTGQITLNLNFDKPLKADKYASKLLIKRLNEDTKLSVLSKVKQISKLLNVEPIELRFKATTSRWGSCNTKKQITFSSYMAQLPDNLINYVVAHELSHIIEMNHSPDFWALVAEVIPDFKKCRRDLKKYKLEIFLKKR